MMKSFLAAFILLLIPSISFADDWGLSINVTGGSRTLSYPSSNLWSNVNNQSAGDVRFEATKQSYPVTLAIGTSNSSSQSKLCDAVSNINCQMGVSELYVGALKYFGDSSFIPFIGGGLSSISTTGSVTANSIGLSASQSDTQTAFYANGGALYRFGLGLNLGLDVRAAFGSKGYSQFLQYGLLVGYSW
jgi:hypothetical protein